jgi:hypothetical protein
MGNEISSEVSMGLHGRAALCVSHSEQAVSSFLMISCPTWQQRFLLNGKAIRRQALKLARKSLDSYRTVTTIAASSRRQLLA